MLIASMKRGLAGERQAELDLWSVVGYLSIAAGHL
jgi:hypothetical protein